ncbi:hypothetical protein B484DRAFT_89803 [Ochromonadaceae sp. CCMP2298]|nr:hypothetical protein B484DRAFT_89803 [Ochromonadaceae sp. CCMP2298]
MVEMGLSSLGREEKHTRQGYKEKQKRKAFASMEEIADNLNMHKLVVHRAKEVFTQFREAREAVHQYEGVVCACLVLAYQEMGRDYGNQVCVYTYMCVFVCMCMYVCM